MTAITKASSWPLSGDWGTDVGLRDVRGAGAYGDMDCHPAEDDTGIRPVSGASGQQPGATPGAMGPASKECYLNTHYGGADETGLDGGEVRMAGGTQGPGSPRVQHQHGLTVFDDDA